MPGTDGLAVCRILRDRGQPHADPDADRAPRGLRPGRRSRRRRRRLPREAVRARRALRARARAAAAEQRHRRRTPTRCASATSSLDPTRRQAWRGGRELELTKTEFDLLELLMFNAGIVVTRDIDLRAHLGLRLRDVVEVARRVHRVPAAQDRGRRRAAAHPHGPRRRLHGSRAHEPAAPARARRRDDVRDRRRRLRVRRARERAARSCGRETDRFLLQRVARSPVFTGARRPTVPGSRRPRTAGESRTASGRRARRTRRDRADPRRATATVVRSIADQPAIPVDATRQGDRRADGGGPRSARRRSTATDYRVLTVAAPERRRGADRAQHRRDEQRAVDARPAPACSSRSAGTAGRGRASPG